jgi:potassium-dependent mechanosensitive channel
MPVHVHHDRTQFPGPRAHRERAGLVLLLLLALATGVTAAARAAGPSTGVTPAARAASPSTPAAIPVAEISQRAEEVNGLLRALERDLRPSAQIEKIERELGPVTSRLDARVDRTRQTLQSGAELGLLDTLADLWQASRMGLATWVETLTVRATWLEQQRAALVALAETWTLTRTEARAAKVPPAVFQRITDVLGAIAETQAKLDGQRSAMLVLQDRVARELSRCEEALAEVEQARQRAVSDLFVRESPPIWRARPAEVASVAAVGAALERQIDVVRRFARDHTDRLALHAILILALIVFLWRAKRRAHRLEATPTAAQALSVLFDQPIAAGLVLGLLGGSWLYAGEPRMARLVAQVGLLVPMVLVVRRLITPQLRSALYTLAAFFLVDLLRDLVLPLPLLERTIFILELLAAVVLFGLFVRSERMKDLLDARGASTLGRTQQIVAGVALAALTVALVSGIVGNMSLARLLAAGILNSGYLGLILAAGRRLAEGLVAFALRVWPLNALRLVENHRAFIEWRAGAALRVIAVLGWIVGMLDYFSLLPGVVSGVRRVFGATLTVGALSVSLADVAAFTATIYVAFLISSIVRYVLEEDVFPRLTLRPGLPYALSSLVRYSIVFVGFLVALAALGLNFDRITVLGGALGLGVGFGLQNIVNNFVSGLIVLFERPVRVGDAVQIGDVQGEVRRIGIRSSTVRTWEGADVVVPNSQLVSDKVTNWTPFDQRRRLEIQVSVAYGSAPEDVLKILSEAAKSHPDVLAEPTPLALFVGFGDSALRFQVWAWTARLGRFGAIKSEVGIAVYAALREAGLAIPFPQQEVRLLQTPPGPPEPPAGDQKDQPTPTR